jgi:hypothetical protein
VELKTKDIYAYREQIAFFLRLGMVLPLVMYTPIQNTYVKYFFRQAHSRLSPSFFPPNQGPGSIVWIGPFFYISRGVYMKKQCMFLGTLAGVATLALAGAAAPIPATSAKEYKISDKGS